MNKAAATQIIQDAINNTEDEYLELCARQRAGLDDKRLGSYYPDMTWEEVLLKIKQATWEEYSHPDVMHPAQAFICRDLGGIFGLIQTKDLNPQDEILLSDPKSTGAVEGVIKGRHSGVRVNHTIMLIGSRDNSIPKAVWTWHPGDPVRPSLVYSKAWDGVTISKDKALELGFEWIKTS